MKAIMLMLSILFAISTEINGQICCVPDQFEAFMFYDDANVFIDAETAYSYSNGSIKAAYDYTNHRAYLDIVGVELTPLVPFPIPQSFTFINDFARGIQYVFHGTSCTKYLLLRSMPRQCLPDSAIHTSSGFIGDNETAVETYAYSLPGSPTVYTAIVDRKACMAVQMTFNSGAAVPDSGDLGSLQVSDVTMGIKDPSIFTPPKSCDGLEEELPQFEETRFLRSAKKLSVSLPFFN